MNDSFFSSGFQHFKTLSITINIFVYLPFSVIHTRMWSCGILENNTTLTWPFIDKWFSKSGCTDKFFHQQRTRSYFPTAWTACGIISGLNLI